MKYIIKNHGNMKFPIYEYSLYFPNKPRKIFHLIYLVSVERKIKEYAIFNK